VVGDEHREGKDASGSTLKRTKKFSYPRRGGWKRPERRREKDTKAQKGAMMGGKGSARAKLRSRCRTAGLIVKRNDLFLNRFSGKGQRGGLEEMGEKYSTGKDRCRR